MASEETKRSKRKQALKMEGADFARLERESTGEYLRLPESTYQEQREAESTVCGGAPGAPIHASSRLTLVNKLKYRERVAFLFQTDNHFVREL